MGLFFQNPIQRALKNIPDHYSEHLKAWSPGLLFNYKATALLIPRPYMNIYNHRRESKSHLNNR